MFHPTLGSRVIKKKKLWGVICSKEEKEGVNVVEALPKGDSWLKSDFEIILQQYGSFKRPESRFPAVGIDFWKGFDTVSF